MLDKKVLVLGSGGREYAFAWKFLKDEEVQKVYCAPGNGGTKAFCTNLNLDLNNHEQVLEKITELDIDITIVGSGLYGAKNIKNRYLKLINE